ncbi:MAG TPA: type II secretion system protein [Candidatus Xenobia bacterium]|jgi:Tfp pilus assembly protein PilV
MKKRRAFTLIECIIACFVVMCAFLCVASIIPVASHQAGADKNRLTALRVAQNVMSEVRSRPFGSSLGSLEGPVKIDGEVVEGHPVETEVFTVAHVTPTIPSGADYGTVAVTVTWLEGLKAPKSLTLTGGITREP